MRPLGSTKPIIFGFVLAISITLTLPYNAVAAAHSVGGFRGFGSRGLPRQQFSSPPRQFFTARFNGVGFNRFNHVAFNRAGFFGVGGFVDEQPAMIQEFQPAATTAPMEPVNGIYVQPRWVDGGQTVQPAM